jgi:hypothetical protein
MNFEDPKVLSDLVDKFNADLNAALNNAADHAQGNIAEVLNAAEATARDLIGPLVEQVAAFNKTAAQLAATLERIEVLVQAGLVLRFGLVKPVGA